MSLSTPVEIGKPGLRKTTFTIPLFCVILIPLRKPKSYLFMKSENRSVRECAMQGPGPIQGSGSVVTSQKMESWNEYLPDGWCV